MALHFLSDHLRRDCARMKLGPDRIISGMTPTVADRQSHRADLARGHAVDALVAAYTGWLHPEHLDAPPEQ